MSFFLSANIVLPLIQMPDLVIEDEVKLSICHPEQGGRRETGGRLGGGVGWRSHIFDWWGWSELMGNIRGTEKSVSGATSPFLENHPVTLARQEWAHLSDYRTARSFCRKTTSGQTHRKWPCSRWEKMQQKIRKWVNTCDWWLAVCWDYLIYHFK